MKIFSPPESAPKAEGLKKSGKRAKRAPVEKAQVSESEIREKLAAHVQTSNTAKSQVIKKNNQADLGSGFMNPQAKAKLLPEGAALQEGREEGPSKSLKESHLLLSDVKLNDPNDSNTQEKLKSVLRSGAFSFNPKEKDTLEKILAGS